MNDTFSDELCMTETELHRTLLTPSFIKHRVSARLLRTMVHVMKGVLIECDPQMKQFLLHLDESNALGSKFIIQDLDQTHLFVSAEIIEVLKNRIDNLMDQINFVEIQ